MKKNIKKLKNKLRNVYKNIFKYIKSMDKTTKRLIILWSIIVAVIIILIFVCNYNNSNNKKHFEYEKNISSAALSYVQEFELYPTSNQKLKLDIEVLKENRDLDVNDVIDDTCSGYAEIYYDADSEKYVIDSYISCDNYQTSGYEK